MKKIEYTNERGEVVKTFYANPEGIYPCPKCGLKNTRCQGSFHKCMDCFERFETALTTIDSEPPKHEIVFVVKE